MNEMKTYETEMLIDAEDLQELDEDERAYAHILKADED